LNGQVGEQEEGMSLLIILIKHMQTGEIQDKLCEDSTMTVAPNVMMIVMLF
jgi:hypothetical protein